MPEVLVKWIKCQTSQDMKDSNWPSPASLWRKPGSLIHDKCFELLLNEEGEGKCGESKALPFDSTLS